MVIRKQAKVKRYRGSKTHGCGSMKKRRGAGNRGGRGNAGTGKRNNSKVPTYWKQKKKYLGKFGFKKKGSVVGRNSISIHLLELHLDNYVEAKKAELKGDVYTVDLAKVGYDKLVSNGKATKKMNITVASASQNAVEKVSAAGGNVTIGAYQEAPAEEQPKKEAKKKAKKAEAKKE